MAYDERLAARIRTLLADRDDVEERRMFGGLTFMVAGRMCCGVNRDELVVRLDPHRETEALARPGARRMDLTGRPMRGFVSVEPSALRGASLGSWVRQAVRYADSVRHP
jgi:TfoX/Sxy family transcriptional regulator of competence genes